MMTSTGVEAHALTGIWAADEGYQVVEFLFRSDGGYQQETRSTDSSLSYAWVERGRYELDGLTLTTMPYEYFGEPVRHVFDLQLVDDALTLSVRDSSITQTYQL